MSKFQTPTGQLAARIHGARKELMQRARSAYDLAAENEPYAAAALRGKARAYNEAADLLAALDQGRRIPKRRRWTGWVAPGRSNRRSVGPEDTGVPEGAERFTEHFAVTVNTKCNCGQTYDPATIPVEGEAFEYRSSKGSTSWCIATDVRPGPGDGQYSFKPRWPATSEEIERSQKRIEHLRGEVGSR